MTFYRAREILGGKIAGGIVEINKEIVWWGGRFLMARRMGDGAWGRWAKKIPCQKGKGGFMRINYVACMGYTYARSSVWLLGRALGTLCNRQAGLQGVLGIA